MIAPVRGHTVRPTHPAPAGASNRRVSVPAPGAQQLLRLQRGAGNAAVTGLVVQRDDKKLLTSAQAATAVTFYRSRPDLYTADVIKRIQELVKTPATGIPDAAMAQGWPGNRRTRAGR
jgi:hypothetical protein